MTDLLRAARELRGTILETRDETESARQLAPRVVAALVKAGLCRLAVAQEEGGSETGPAEALRIYEELAAADASVAWIVWNNWLPGLLSQNFAAALRAQMFADPTALWANSMRPSGQAVVVDGGVRVSGRWSLVSGCTLADRLLLRAVIAGKTVQTDLHMFAVPRPAVRIIDTWNVNALRGTGSHDVVADDVFVPVGHVISFAGPAPTARPLYRMPFAATLGAGCAAICLGLARAATAALLDIARIKPNTETKSPIREHASLQSSLATAAAATDAARLFLFDAVEDAWKRCCADGTPDDGQKARIWAATQHAARTSLATVRTMYELAGTSALYADCPLERAHRDIHAVTQHVVLSNMWMQDVGRVQLGMEPANPLF